MKRRCSVGHGEFLIGRAASKNIDNAGDLDNIRNPSADIAEMASIPLHHARPQHHLKLLELPPDLLGLLQDSASSSSSAAAAAETPPRLYLKAPPPPSSSDPPSSRTPANDNFVNLCSLDRTWHLRQVNSSNSLMILQAARHRDGRGDGDQHIGLSSIAQCNATLETVPPAPGKRSAEPFLQRRTRFYDRRSDYGQQTAAPVVSEAAAQRAIAALFDDIPLSQADCQRQWVESCCFVDYDDSPSSPPLCWRPSVGVKLDTWRKLLEVSVLRSIDIKQQFLVSDLWNAIVDEEETPPFPRPAFDAVIRRITPVEDQLDAFPITSQCPFLPFHSIR